MTAKTFEQFEDLKSEIVSLKLKATKYKELFELAQKDATAKDQTIRDLKSENSAFKDALEFEQESNAFEEFAVTAGLPLNQHPLHYLFLNNHTNEARQIWKAAIAYFASKRGKI